MHRAVEHQTLTNAQGAPVPVDLEPRGSELGLDIARGRVPGASCWRGLGERTVVTVVTSGVDVWESAATEVPLPNQVTGERMQVQSSDDEDGAAGLTGALTVKIHYLDHLGDQKVEVLTLTGTAPALTNATNIRFVNEIHTKTVGSNGVSVGNVTISQQGAPLVVYNLISAGGNMSLSITRMVPKDYSFYLKGWTCASTVQNKQVTMRIRATQHGGALVPGVFLFIDTAVLEVANYVRDWVCPERIPALAIIKVSAWAAQAAGPISASFDGYLIAD